MNRKRLTRCGSGRLTFSLLIVGVCLCAIPAHALEALNEAEMASVTGQQGVQISLDYYYNAVKTEYQTFEAADATPTGEPTGYGVAACGGGDGYAAALGDMSCRLSWQLANRGQAATAGVGVTTDWAYNDGTTIHTMNGEWLVWKAGWLSLSANGLNLDASFLGEDRDEGSLVDLGSAGDSYEDWLGNGASSNPDTMPSSGGNVEPVYGSFVDSDGNCLMPAGQGLDPCSVNYIKAMPALKTHYANGGGSYDGTTRTLTGYNDARFGMQIIGLSAEYDGTDINHPAPSPGWMLNNGGSFTSLRIADNNGNQAGITFGGNFYLYGF